MKKSSKGLILTALATIAIGISGLFQPINKINKDIGIKEAKAYNHSTENALDNVFIQDNNLILPFIFDNANQTETLNIREKFAKANLTIKNVSTETVGTGTQITVNENTNVYNVVIYGDVNGDGKINLIDVQRIILHYLDPATNALTGLNAIAANVNNKDNNDINLIDAQRIILFYLGTLNSGLVVQEPEASNPENPAEDVVSRITITPPTKYIYTVGEELNLVGGKINITYVSGKVEIIDMQRSMVSGYNKNVPGRQTITVSYRVNNTVNFTTTFEVLVNVLDKEITTIISSINLTEGTCYKPVEFSLKSGENEENININALNLRIKDSNGQIINNNSIVTIEKKNGANGVILVSFIAKVADSYTIIPSIGTVTGTDIKIIIKEDTSINKMKLVPINNSVFSQDTETKAEVEFYHIYPDNREIKIEKALDMSKVSIVPSINPITDMNLLESTMENTSKIKFFNKDMYLLPDNKDGDTIIKYVSITPEQVGNLRFSIKVTDNDNISNTYTLDTVIEVKERELIVNDKNNNITLYKTKESAIEANKQDENVNIYIMNNDYGEYVYTLIPIYKTDSNGKEVLDENGHRITDVKVKDINQLGYENGKISFVDNIIDEIVKEGLTDKLNDIMESINIKAFNANENLIYNPNTGDTIYANSDVYYIGISLEPDYEENEQIAEKLLESIIVKYSGKETKLTISIVE